MQPYRQSQTLNPYLKNHLLLALPTQTGSYFADTLTLICEHNADGAMGLILNRPSRVPLADLIRQVLADLGGADAPGLEASSSDAGAVLLNGGPMAREQAFVVHSAQRSYQQSLPLDAHTVLSTDLQVLQDIAQGEGPEDFLVAQGYAGWGPGQLEAEMVDDAWVALSFQSPLSMQSLFKLPPKQRLQYAARSAGLDLSLMAGRIGYA